MFTDFWLFAFVNALPVILVFATNPLRGVSRIIAPDTLSVVMLYAIFGVRPLFEDRFMASSGKAQGFYGMVPTADGQFTASVVGTVLLWSMTIGVIARAQLGARGKNPARFLQPRDEVHRGASSASKPLKAVLLTTASIFLYCTLLISVMGLAGFLSMFGGRSAAASTGGLPEAVMALPLVGSIASATLILSTSDRRRIDGPALWAIGYCTTASLIAVSQLGNRRLMIPALLIVATAALMRRPARLRLWHLGAGALALTAFAVLPRVRSAGSRLEGENLFDAIFRSVGEAGFSGVGASFFTSYDTEMFDYIAMLAPYFENGRIPYGLGSGSFSEFLTHPLPSALTPGDGRTSELKAYLFNHFCYGVGCDIPNPVQSIGGLLFFEAWYIGVLVGGIGAGFVLRALSYRWHEAARSSVARNLVTAVFASYAMIAVRTDTIFAVWWCIYALIVTVVVLILMGEYRGSRRRQASVNHSTGTAFVSN